MRKKFTIFFCLWLLAQSYGYTQVSEDFRDSDFVANPAWAGSSSGFIINDNFQLQSSDTIAGSNFYLSTKSELVAPVQWEFRVQMAFNPSAANYIDAYLTASDSNLSLNATSGYFVRIGNTDDEISLYRKEATGGITKIIDGADGILNRSNNVLKIKITRDSAYQWNLYRDVSGTGNSYIAEGSARDTTFLTAGYFGFLIKQSTNSFFKKHFFDDIEIKRIIPDVIPPRIQSATAISAIIVDVLFDEPLDNTSSREAARYSADNGLGMPVSATLDDGNPSLVHLLFAPHLSNGVAYTLTVDGVKDVAGNPVENATSSFSFYTAGQYDIIIDELFADPDPQVGLPIFKYVELKNISRFPIDLQGWKLTGGSSSATLPSFNLRPDSFVIVCAANALSAYSIIAPALGVANFPSLNITGGTIILESSSGKTIHAVQYDAAYYKNELKKEGGWSLEMIDTQNPCTGFDNWKASMNPIGGTPGGKNSVDGTNKDEVAPKLLRAFAVDNNTISLVFDEPVDSLQAATVANYTIGNGLSPVNAFPVFPFFNKVNITVDHPIAAGIIYTINVNGISDCSNNSMGIKNSAKFGVAQDADSLDLVINELLFNPLPAGEDYIELYNRSPKIIDLGKIYIANRNTSNVVGSIEPLAPESILLFPREFVILTTDPAVVKSQYITTNAEAFLKLKSMPSFPDDKGDVIILDYQGNIIDEVKYVDQWHFPLLHNAEGVSLERIDYDGPSSQNNFHSAATSVGYGTPGYKNSQYRINEVLQGEITVTPEIFSPDNDGIDDVATINYDFPGPGYVTNISIFDATGRLVRYLQKNSLSGVKGYYRWDGLDDKNRKLPQGIYVIYTEIFNKEGKKKQFKKAVVLGRRF